MSYSDTYTNSKTKTFEPGNSNKNLLEWVSAQIETESVNLTMQVLRTAKRYRITIAEVKKQPKLPTIKPKQIK